MTRRRCKLVEIPVFKRKTLDEFRGGKPFAAGFLQFVNTDGALPACHDNAVFICRQDFAGFHTGRAIGGGRVPYFDRNIAILRQTARKRVECADFVCDSCARLAEIQRSFFLADFRCINRVIVLLWRKAGASLFDILQCRQNQLAAHFCQPVV